MATLDLSGPRPAPETSAVDPSLVTLLLSLPSAVHRLRATEVAESCPECFRDRVNLPNGF